MTDDVHAELEQLFRLAASRKVHARHTAAAGVTVSHPGQLLLRGIASEGPLSLSDLARRADMDPSAVGRQVRQLEADGLVRRTADAADGRITVVSATPRGRGVDRRLGNVHDRHLADVLDRWSEADRADLARLLHRFVQDLRAVSYRSDAEQRAV